MTKSQFFQGTKLAMIDGTSWIPTATGYQQIVYAYVWLPPERESMSYQASEAAIADPEDFLFQNTEHRPFYIDKIIAIGDADMPALLLAGDPNKTVLRAYEQLMQAAKEEMWSVLEALYCGEGELAGVQFAWTEEANRET